MRATPCQLAALIALSLVAKSSSQVGTTWNPPSDIDIFFAYTKEELACFKNGSLTHLIGEGSSVQLLSKASMIVLLQLAHRPSQKDMDNDGVHVKFGLGSCEKAGGGQSLDEQMSAALERKHKGKFTLLQIHQYAEDDPMEADQSLLSIWYDKYVVKPGPSFAYKNILNGSGGCTETRPAKTGVSNVKYDMHVSQCKQSKPAWWQYGSSKSSLVTSWIPADGSRFAIFGSNLPSAYIKGKNAMLARAMTDISEQLQVDASRVFILGDMNTRLLSSAFGSCNDVTCKLPDDEKQALELSKQGWETILGRTEAEGDIDACKGVTAFTSETECNEALIVLQTCRRKCIADLACNAEGLGKNDVGNAWSLLDPKRGTGHLDLLGEYFHFPPDMTVDVLNPSEGGKWRLPTYKRLGNADVAQCASASPFLDTCEASPCRAVAGSTSCEASMSSCFEQTVESKSDRLPPDDPVRGSASYLFSGAFVKPQLGWLDTFGYSKQMQNNVDVSLFQDRPVFTMGDHGSFIAAVTLHNDGIIQAMAAARLSTTLQIAPLLICAMLLMSH